MMTVYNSKGIYTLYHYPNNIIKICHQYNAYDDGSWCDMTLEEFESIMFQNRLQNKLRRLVNLWDNGSTNSYEFKETIKLLNFNYKELTTATASV